ncbi:MAG TPA: Rieske (2Fe-2S) protein, partial [Acidimicrobiia bacterium]|nr:Rieske (2Fe-2S) protein [Acidimicrobiia bacterium]
MSDIDHLLVQPDGFLPKERYTTTEFSDLEFERLWPHVWQIAGREEELDASGDFLEYTIGDDSILVVRTDRGTLSAFHNACRHRGTPLAAGCGTFATGEIRCPYHAWTYA